MFDLINSDLHNEKLFPAAISISIYSSLILDLFENCNFSNYSIAIFHFFLSFFFLHFFRLFSLRHFSFRLFALRFFFFSIFLLHRFFSLRLFLLHRFFSFFFIFLSMYFPKNTKISSIEMGTDHWILGQFKCIRENQLKFHFDSKSDLHSDSHCEILD